MKVTWSWPVIWRFSCSPPVATEIVKKRRQTMTEPRHEKKTTKWVCAQQRLRSAWATAQSDQSSLSAWRNLGSLATHWALSEDSDQTGQTPRLIWVFAGRTHILLVLSCRGSYYASLTMILFNHKNVAHVPILQKCGAPLAAACTICSGQRSEFSPWSADGIMAAQGGIQDFCTVGFDVTNLSNSS